MKEQLTRIFLLGSLITLFGLIAFAQTDTQTRSITSDDFASKRPAGGVGSINNAKKPAVTKKQIVRRTSYKYVRRDKKAVRRSEASVNAKPGEKKETANAVSEVGVTIWRLRPSIKSDAGFKIPVLINKLKEFWTAERIDAETYLKSGDRVRLAIESSVPGYLYVINSEIFSDGTYGEPSVIFPWPSDEDNSVRPGMLVDIPDQTEDLPYFVINPKQKKYIGELLTVIVSPRPLSALKTDDEGRITNLEELMELELGAEAEIFSRNDSQDKIYTQEEASAACGGKTRQLVREKSTQPCGEKSRQLTREEPLPQTIYRVKAFTGQPAVAFVRLNVGN